MTRYIAIPVDRAPEGWDFDRMQDLYYYKNTDARYFVVAGYDDFNGEFRFDIQDNETGEIVESGAGYATLLAATTQAEIGYGQI